MRWSRDTTLAPCTASVYQTDPDRPPASGTQGSMPQRGPRRDSNLRQQQRAPSAPLLSHAAGPRTATCRPPTNDRARPPPQPNSPRSPITDLSTHSRRKPSSSVCSRPGFCLHNLTKARSSLSLRESMVAEQKTTALNTQPFPYPTTARRRGSCQPACWPRPPPPKPRPPPPKPRPSAARRPEPSRSGGGF